MAGVLGMGIIRTAAIPICLFVLMTGQVYAQSNRIVLITEDEAQLPAPPASDLTFRAGISRGPTITLVSPSPSDRNVRSPLRLQLKFEGRGGALVDADSLKLTYVKNPAVDLTERVKSFSKPDGLDVAEAELPPGTHTIRAEVKDKDGRSGFINFNLSIAK